MARTRKILPLALVFLALPLFALVPQDEEKTVAQLVEELTRNRDEADPDLVVQLANHKTMEAANGLIEVFDKMGSLYMKREVLRALELFDGTDAQQKAGQKMLDVATDSDDRELREMALESISRCRALGKGFLESVIMSPAEDDVREQAMRYHLELSNESDFEWYESLYDPEQVKERLEDQKKDGKRGKKKDDEEEGTLMVHSLPEIRAMAFERIANKFDEAKLVEATEDRYWVIRTLALEELAQKDEKKALEVAEKSVGDGQRRGSERVSAAKVYFELDKDKAIDELLDLSGKSPDLVGNELRFAIADLLAGIEDEKFQKKLTKLIGKGKDYEKLFALRINVNNKDEKALAAIRKGLKDKERDVRMETVRVLGVRKDKESLEDIRKAMEKDEKKDRETLAVYLTAIGEIEGKDADFVQELVGYTNDEDRDLRNAAIEVLADVSGIDHLEVYESALESDQWDTRLTALHALEELRNRDSVGKIIARMEHETGRMIHEFAASLFRLTGQPYGQAFGGWKAWWEREGKDLDLISGSELKKRIKEEEVRRLKQRSRASFFGIRIISKRVIFIIDVSGSMNEPMRTRYVSDSTGETRMTVAIRELKKSIESLERGALFNIITFSSGVTPWLEGGVVSSEQQTREEAMEYADKLGAGGGTNLYGAIKVAMEDAQADSIYILSDGEPTVGEEIDPRVIRDHVARWNEHRGLEIHCVAIGGSLQVLEWIAEDSGGTYIKFN